MLFILFNLVSNQKIMIPSSRGITTGYTWTDEPIPNTSLGLLIIFA